MCCTPRVSRLSFRSYDYDGIKGVANKWFQSFLEDRKHFTSVQGSKSAEKPIKYDISQGSF